MFTVELYARIRRAVMVNGLSRREAARRSRGKRRSPCPPTCRPSTSCWRTIRDSATGALLRLDAGR